MWYNHLGAILWVSHFFLVSDREIWQFTILYDFQGSFGFKNGDKILINSLIFNDFKIFFTVFKWKIRLNCKICTYFQRQQWEILFISGRHWKKKIGE